jgi:hypothetical protein
VDRLLSSLWRTPSAAAAADAAAADAAAAEESDAVGNDCSAEAARGSTRSSTRMSMASKAARVRPSAASA